jgi:adenylate cyclase
LEEFRNSKSKQLFEFLKGAYVKDDEVLRVPLDRCGWRSLVQIAEGTGSAANTLYRKKPGQVDADLQDLITNGLVEMRYFEGERGRGGEVMRFRLTNPRNQQLKDPETIELSQTETNQEKITRPKELGRRLAAIMFTDIVGFTEMGQRNESLALVLLEEHNKLLRPIFQRHRGKEVKTIGDSFLVDFPNALDAVRCAYEIQRVVKEFNIGMSLEKQIHLRVGIHLGDIVESSDGDIVGDAVNIASRVPALADSDGICLTRQVYDQVQNKIELRMISLGAMSLKNVASPLEIYKVQLPWDKSGELKTEPNRLAILPFANISPDGRDEYFADGMTEELISVLSRIRGLKVISRTSAMHYKGTNKTVDEIARELNIGTILEGSVRKADGDLRISAQLIDARKDEHLWSEDYDRKLEDVFAIQREIAQKVAEALSVTLVSSEKEIIGRPVTHNPRAYTLYLKGRYYWNERTKDAFDKAIKYFEAAIQVDPKYALAYSGLADCYALYGAYGWAKPEDSFPKAKEFAMKSIDIDPGLAEPHTSLADVFNSYDGLWRESEAEYKKALELKPSYATAHMWYGLLLLFLTRFEEAYEHVKLAAELDPLSRISALNPPGILVYMGRPRDAVEQLETALKADPEYAHMHNELGWAYYSDSRVEEGIKELRKAVTKDQGDPILKADLAIALGFTGQGGEASKILRELEESSKVNYISRMKFAQVLFSLGRNDEGFSLLEEAREDHSLFTQHGGHLLDIRLFPWFAGVREDPRWDAFVQRLGIPEAR